MVFVFLIVYGYNQFTTLMKTDDLAVEESSISPSKSISSGPNSDQFVKRTLRSTLTPITSTYQMLDYTQFSIMNEKYNETTFPDHHICIVSRTHDNETLANFNSGLYSFLAQAMPQNVTLEWDLILINSNGGSLTQQQIAALEYINSSHIHWFYIEPSKIIRQETYGYEATDHMLQAILHWNNETKMTGNEKLTQTFCEYLLFTNSDNIYNKAYFETVISKMNEKIDLIGTTYVTHHTKGLSPRNMVIKPKFVRSRIDLGAVLISKKSILRRPNIAFLQCYYLIAADWFFFEKLLAQNSSTYIFQQCLFFHQ